MSKQTYWNGEPTPCRRVLVRVGTAHLPTLWHNGLEGTERRGVEVSYGGVKFLIDDDNGEGAPERSDRISQMLAAIGPRPPAKAGDGWLKVTEGRGAPFGAFSRFRSLPTDSVVIRELEPAETSA